MKIDKDTEMSTLLDMSDHVIDKMETWGWSPEMEDAIYELRHAHSHLQSTFGEDRQTRDNV